MAKSNFTAGLPVERKEGIRSKLTDRELAILARMVEEGMSYEEIAETFERPAV